MGENMKAFANFLRFALFVMVAFPFARADADSIEDFYRGKTLTFIVGAPPGGVYDLFGRMTAKYISRYIPGHPITVVQNELGSGSVQAMNRIYYELPQDGTVIGAPSNAAAFLPLLGLAQARFDPKKMLWLGSPTAESSVFFVWSTLPIQTFDDLKTHEVIVGTNGPNASPAFFVKTMNAIFGTRIKVVYGYTGVPDAMLALQRGEIQGYTGIFWNQLKAGYGNLIAENKLRFLLQFALAPIPELSGVPLVSDLLQSNDDKQLFSAVMAPLALGYPLVMGPGVPADRAAALREAVAETFKDKDFLAEATKAGLAVAPLTSEQTSKVVTDSYAISPTLTERLRTLYNAH
jgi:tripartite-type tricarboxylate transporter receptor subunit TctC